MFLNMFFSVGFVVTAFISVALPLLRRTGSRGFRVFLCAVRKLIEFFYRSCCAGILQDAECSGGR